MEFFREGRRIVVSWPARRPDLPVRVRGGGIAMYQWGSDESEYVANQQPGYLYKWPEGAHVPLETIRNGDWWKLKPEPVKVAIAGFQISHSNLGVPTEHWVKLKPGQFLQGALVHRFGSVRLYIVTIDPPSEYARVADPWPRIVSIRGALKMQEHESQPDESEREAKKRARRERG